MAPASGSPQAAGCVVCRSRKVRCDRSQPHCGNCERLGVQCPGYQNEGENIPRSELLKLAEEIYTSSGVERRRFGSCEPCRVAKERCTKTRPACRRCSQRDLQCVYQARPQGSRRHRGEDKAGKTAMAALTPVEEGSQASMGEGRSDGSVSEVAQQLSTADVNIQILSSGHLPDNAALRNRLVHTFFDRIHPLRCSSFVHKPSFLFSMDRGIVLDDYGEPLLYAMCALAARVIKCDHMRTAGSMHDKSGDLSSSAGFGWAERARKNIMHEIHEPTLQQVMTLLLLCDYALETDQNALAYVLSGCAFRSIRLLGLDVPRQPQTSIEYEAGLRLVWASYSTDAMIATGVALNSAWQNNVPCIPLPCSHRDFLARSPGVVQYLHTVNEPADLALTQSLDLPALTVVLVRLRSEVLRIIRETPSPDCSIWDAASPFMKMIEQLDTFRANLPERFTLTDLNVYTHKSESTLGAVFAMHFFYHAAVFDLTRIALPGFTFPLAPSFRDAPASFRSQCQERCRFHANAISDVVSTGFQHAPIAFDDPFCVHAVSEATKIQIIYTATVDNTEASMALTMNNVRTNVRLLRYMHVQQVDENPYLRLLQPLCMLFGFRGIAEEMRSNTGVGGSSVEAEVTGSADIHHLASWAPFRRAISQIQSKQTSTASPASISSDPVASQLQPPILSVSSTGAGGQMMEASMEDYTRAAEQLGGYITWDMSELMVPDLVPPWGNFDWLNPNPAQQ